VRQNYQTAYQNVVEFARNCYGHAGIQLVEERLDPERRVGEIILSRPPNPRSVSTVTVGEIDPRTSVVTTHFPDTAWASHAPSFEAAAMGASAACRAP
jgi:hypothetical protein